MAEIMENQGNIYSFDLYNHKIKLITDGAERLGIDIINAQIGDASVYNKELIKADKILCDVPCAGLGVIRRKPEIKYKSLSEFERLPEIQYNIAQNTLNYLAIGGEMVYSTCTVRKAENEEVVERLLKNNPDIVLSDISEIRGRKYSNPVTFFPDDFGGDGFFVAKLKKIK